MAKLYQLTDGDKALIRKAQDTDNPNWFTSWFLKSDSSGYYIKPDVLYKPYDGRFPEKYQEFIDRYHRVYSVWSELGKPDTFRHEDKTIKVRKSRDYKEPIFHMHFGAVMQEWQLDTFQARQRIKIALGGYGSGKTIGVGVLPMLYYAATIPGFRGLFLAPNSNQAKESWRIALQLMFATPYADKFLVSKNAKDPPSLTIGNDMVGENLIQTFPIDDPAGVEKFETLTLDYVVIDQAEKMPNIQEIRRVIGSRFRGQIMGRDIVGQMAFLANAKDNPELWDLFDEAEDDPDNIYAVQPATFDNIYITPEQLSNMEQDVGGTDEDIRVHIEGGRPLLTGEQFPASLQANIKSDILDEKMRQGIDAHIPGFVHIKAPKKVGTVRWEMPYEPDRMYCVIADPGSDNPPKRNSAVIMVWDYTDFPEQPATMQAFNWVYGNHRPEPWITQYLEYVERYRAKTTNAFDSTAWQSGWQESLWAINRTIAGGMPLHLNHKSKYLIFTKRLCELGLLKVPSIQGLFTQLGRYVVPDNDKKLVQDIVMAFIMSGGWLEHLMYGEKDQQEETEQNVREFLEGRYSSEALDRYDTEKVDRYA